MSLLGKLFGGRDLPAQDKSRVLTRIRENVKGDGLRVLIAAAIGKVGPDDPVVTSVAKDVTDYGLPPADRARGADAPSWWTTASADDRLKALDDTISCLK